MIKFKLLLCNWNMHGLVIYQVIKMNKAINFRCMLGSLATSLFLRNVGKCYVMQSRYFLYSTFVFFTMEIF